MSDAIARAGEMTTEQITLLKRTICKGSTDDELRLFVQVCNRLQLDPFARQIYAVKRWDKRERKEVMAIQVSIDGFRVVAERTGQYRGQAPVQWCGPDGAWVDVWLKPEPPAAARVAVHRFGFAEPLARVARWDSYVQLNKEGKPTPMWANMPDLMLGKCAEALALRAAFPQDLSGVYTPEEMAQAHEDDAPLAASEPEPRQLAAQTAAPRMRLRDCGDELTLREWLAEHGARVAADAELTARTIAHAETIGLSAEDVRGWLGVAA